MKWIMRRLILLVLALLLAMPAVAGPACAPPPATDMASAHHGDTHKQADDHGDGTLHGCIGCAAPTRLGTPVEMPTEIAAPLYLLPPELAPAGQSGHPEPPPPRLTA